MEKDDELSRDDALSLACRLVLFAYGELEPTSLATLEEDQVAFAKLVVKLRAACIEQAARMTN